MNQPDGNPIELHSEIQLVSVWTHKSLIFAGVGYTKTEWLVIRNPGAQLTDSETDLP